MEKEKMTPLEFIHHRFPELKKVPINELSFVLGGDTILVLMEEYYMYRRILEKTGDSADNYDHYH